MLLWADGFDHYGNAANMVKGSYSQVSVNMTSDPNKVRTGLYALDISGGDNADRRLIRPVTINGETIGIGYGLLTTAGPPGNGYFRYNIYDAAGNPIISAVFNGDSGIDIVCDGVTLASSPALVLVPGAYSYVETVFTLDPTQGRVLVRVNNSVVIDVSNLNTIGGDGTGIPHNAGFVKSGGVSSTWPSWYLDDYVIWDGSGAFNNAPMGDVRCRTIFPEANGLNQDWQANGLPDAFACVAQTPPQPNVDFISASDVGDLSSFDLQAVPSNTGTINGLVIHVNLNKADAGVCGVSAGIGSGGQTDLGGVINPGTGSAYYSRAIQADPNGNKAWTKDSVNAMQAIVERVQ